VKENKRDPRLKTGGVGGPERRKKKERRKAPKFDPGEKKGGGKSGCPGETKAASEERKKMTTTSGGQKTHRGGNPPATRSCGGGLPTETAGVENGRRGKKIFAQLQTNVNLSLGGGAKDTVTAGGRRGTDRPRPRSEGPSKKAF